MGLASGSTRIAASVFPARLQTLLHASWEAAPTCCRLPGAHGRYTPPGGRCAPPGPLPGTNSVPVGWDQSQLRQSKATLERPSCESQWHGPSLHLWSSRQCMSSVRLGVSLIWAWQLGPPALHRFFFYWLCLDRGAPHGFSVLPCIQCACCSASDSAPPATNEPDGTFPQPTCLWTAAGLMASGWIFPWIDTPVWCVHHWYCTLINTNVTWDAVLRKCTAFCQMIPPPLATT